MADPKNLLTTYLKRMKNAYNNYEVNPFCVRGQENDFPS